MLSPCQEAREEGESLENKSATDQDDISFEEVDSTLLIVVSHESVDMQAFSLTQMH